MEWEWGGGGGGGLDFQGLPESPIALSQGIFPESYNLYSIVYVLHIANYMRDPPYSSFKGYWVSVGLGPLWASVAGFMGTNRQTGLQLF